MGFNSMLESIGRAIIFERFREPLRGYMLKAGYERVPYNLLALLFFGCLIATTALFLPVNATYFVDLPLVAQFPAILLFWTVVTLILVAIVMFLIWSVLNIKIYSRTKEMEDKLPDYLALVVTNLRSGMSFDKSLWGAIRPEFGVLAREITMVSKKVMTGNDTGEALDEFARRYDSPILRRSINLVISELESGGEVATVIERVIENLRKTAALKKEMAASVVSYMIFISIIVLVLSPILFGLANTILAVILSFADQIASSPGGAAAGPADALFKTLGQLAENRVQLTQDFRLFSYLGVLVTSIFAAMIVSIIEKGDIRGGLRYIPIFAGVSSLVLFLALRGLVILFGGLLA